MAPTGTSLVLASGIPSNIAQLTGPILIGTLFDHFLFGILTMQLYVYYYSFPNDKATIKFLAWFVYALELVQVCCATADIHFWFGSGYGDLHRLNEVYISPFDTPIMGSIVAFIVQLFFCYRIWALRKGDWYIIICVVIAVISVVQLVGGLGAGASAFAGRYFSAVRVNDIVYAPLWLAGEAIADVLIAVTMTYLLVGSHTELSTQSRSIVSRIVRLVIQTNTVTAGVAVISVIFFVASKESDNFIASTIVLGKLYSNTLLATLNHRIFLRKLPQESTAPSNGSETLEGNGGFVRY